MLVFMVKLYDFIETTLLSFHAAPVFDGNFQKTVVDYQRNVKTMAELNPLLFNLYRSKMK
jgi:hypothetical protein